MGLVQKDRFRMPKEPVRQADARLVSDLCMVDRMLPQFRRNAATKRFVSGVAILPDLTIGNAT